ncbi:hypothetical protein O3M35_009253 [Rhynocoris fuscipes]|uniref:NADH dehydrogenase [ubiquinone] 1 alpha subcomplex assembly factor 4 n=1 Tax=Rhynocoris fuscipes TaxID=488301 RepID=A0AAW1D9U5_9HEMI
MGKVLSVVNRQVNRFNVENRAHKILERDKPIPAPRHPSTVKHSEQVNSESSEVFKELMRKHEEMDNNLKRVYVKSHGAPNPDLRKPSERARLPANRSTSEESEFGYEEPETVPAGRITLKQALQIITSHKEDMNKLSVSNISEKYKISEEDTANLLKYFASFKIHIPEKLSIDSTKSNLKVFLTSSSPNVEQKELKKSDVPKTE